MTPRAVLAIAAAGFLAAACTHDPSPDTAEPADKGGTTHDAAGDAEPTCRREVTEMGRRDEAGTIDWEAIEGSDEEPTDEELESVTIAGDPFPSDVAAVGERPTFSDFPDRLDVATLSDAALVEAVDICYEIGLLADEENEEAGGDEAE
jgi:hypothetical protein